MLSQQCTRSVISSRCSRSSTVVVRSVATVERTAHVTIKRNENFGKLRAGYLFPEIAKRRRAHQEANPDAKIISLGIGGISTLSLAWNSEPLTRLRRSTENPVH
ncbi:MAG: hypothetical protein WDW38_004838 [Sanguina aurantia]